MQTQAQLSGQQGQVPQLIKGGLPLPRRQMATWQKQWHSADDISLRRQILSCIAQFVQRPGSENNMAEFVKHFETTLYHQASSREEYADLNTLRQRIFSLILRMKSSRKVEQQGPQNSYLTPKPGLSNSSTFSVGNSTSTSNAAPAILNVDNPASSFAFDSRRSEPLGGYIGNTFPSINRQAASFSVPGSGFERTGQLSSNPNIPGHFSSNPNVTGQLSSNPNVPGQLGSNPNVSVGGSWMIPTPGLNVETTQGISGSSVQANGCINTSNANSGIVSDYLTVENSGLVSSVSHQRDTMIDNRHQILGQDKRLFSDASQFQNTINAKPDFMQIQSQPDQQQLSYGHKNCNDFVSHTNDIGENINFYDPIIPTELGTSNSSSLASSSANLMTGLPQQQENKPPQTFPGRDQLFQNRLDDSGTRMNQEMEWREGSVKDCSLEGDKQGLVNAVQQNADHNGQACQASSDDTGQSEVVSNDDARPSTQIKEVCNLTLSQQVKRQQWLLIFLRHVSRCLDSGKCGVAYCKVGRESWNHVISCQTSSCSHPRCMPLKRLLKHHKKCRNSECVVCGPVRKYILRHSATSQSRQKEDHNIHSAKRTSVLSNNVESPPTKKVKVDLQDQDAPKALQQSGQSICTFENQEVISRENTLLNPKEENINSIPHNSTMKSHSLDREPELVSPKGGSPVESSLSAGLSNQQIQKINNVEGNQMEVKTISEVGSKPVAESMVLPNGENSKSRDAYIIDTKTSCKVVQIEKPIKAKISGISYIESFTPEQIRQHISSLRKWIGQSKGKVEKNQAVERQMLASACSACGIENLYFDPIPIFCTQCGCRIKRNASYYCAGSGDNSISYCGPCYNAFRSDLVENDGLKVQKSSLVKKKNDEQRVEGWVECDKCKKWQHQICVLFNARINKERSEYICPECCIAEMERSKRIPLSEISVLGAKDLPTTVLSNFIEERLSLKLKEERAERAKQQGKSLNEVITAEGLVVRVISNIDKKLEVKPKFLDLFQQENYPRDYLYKSKMVMLFQEIEGVEVCLFGMYVQEFGSDNPQPNNRWVYLSYLDSVKYFRPDVKTTKGEALRTYVYHEILIAYLDYCKKRGFSACYIWACPPLKGDDYILYCHPEIQKTPKTDKLREWYLNMISKAKKEDIVVANRNLYDYFFTSNSDCKAVVTAARLPYFDGDYWPGAAEDILLQLQQEEDGLQHQKWGKMKKATTKRTTKTSAQAELLGGTSKDMQLMAKLGQSIVAMKEDFIIVHLHHACSRCCSFIISGSRWYCQQCSNNFQLCNSCYEEHQSLVEEERHPAGKRECHPLVKEEVEAVPDQTFDNDDIMESEFFDNRQAFLSLCQGNQYQYDTLRRAKHSSMMVLYHLHNPSAPAFIASCAVCHGELEGGQGWKCKVCTDFDVCNGCYSSEEVKRHPHSFAPRATTADLTSANTDIRKQRMLQIRMMLDVLVHASKCREPSCQYPKCRNMKDLFRHGNSCTKRAMGGCSICKRMWFLLTAHARSCKETVCTVPRCMDIRRHLRRTQMQQESRRRAAVNEMIRQRAAEAAVSQ